MATLRELICASTASTLREYMCVETGGGGDIFIGGDVVIIEEEKDIRLLETNSDIIIINEQADNIVELQEITDIILDTGDTIDVNIY